MAHYLSVKNTGKRVKHRSLAQGREMREAEQFRDVWLYLFTDAV